MGIQDRPYYREEPRGILLGGNQSVVVNLIIINAAVFLVDWFGQGWLNPFLALDPNVFQTWHLWTFLTYGFAHGGIWHIGGNMLMLWFFGRDIEVIYGKRRFLELYLELIVLAGVGHLLADRYIVHSGAGVIGASGGVAGIFALFVCHYPKRTILLFGVVPMPAWALGLLIFAQDLMGFRQAAAGGAQPVAHAAHLTGAAFGLLYYKFHWTLLGWLPGNLKMPRMGSRPKLRVHRPEQENEDIDGEVDRILEKIHRYGKDSLTKKEQKLLEQASRKARNRREGVN